MRLYERLYRGPVKWLIDTSGLKPYAEATYWRAARRLYGPDITISVPDHTCEMYTASWQEYAQLATLLNERIILTDFAERIRETDTVWDIGANIGLYTAVAAEAEAEVVAFDPVPAHCSRIQTNCPTATIRQVALSDQSGTTCVPGGKAVQATWGLHKSAGETEVPVLQPTQVDADPPTVVKIDTEGHEISVLNGLEEMVDELRLCYVEVHESRGVQRETVINRLEAFGLETTILFDRDGTVFLLGHNTE